MNNPNFQQNAMQQNAMQQQRVGVGAQTHFSQHYRQQLQLGKVPQGWQQSVSPDERANLAMQFCTQYRLLKPDTPEMEAMRASVNFESQNFLQAQTKDHQTQSI